MIEGLMLWLRILLQIKLRGCLLALSLLMVLVLSYNSIYFNYNSEGLIFDSLSFWLGFFLLWMILMIIVCSIIKIRNLFVFLINILGIVLIYTFFVRNLLLFYYFFEISLIPVLLIISGWGFQPERLQAYFFLLFYTLFGSLPLLLIIVIMGSLGVYSFIGGLYMMVGRSVLLFVRWFVIIGFLIKLPAFLCHIWLPRAHVEAPLRGSIILAGLLLKLGGYGLIRLLAVSKFILVHISLYLMGLSLIGIVLVRALCFQLNDIKALVAYSSVVHMGLCLGGIFRICMVGYIGSVFIFIRHGLASSGLFMIVTLSYERSHSRSIFLNKGYIYMTGFNLLLFFFCIINMRSPPSINLFSELCLLYSLIWKNLLTLYMLPLGSFLAVGFVLYLFSALYYGSSYRLIYSLKIVLVSEFHGLSLHLIPLNLLVLNLFIIKYLINLMKI